MIPKKDLLLVVLLFFTSAVYSTAGDGTVNPFRVAVLIGDQWDDPMNYVVTRPENTTYSDSYITAGYERKVISTDYAEGAEYSGYAGNPEISGPSDFYYVMIMLKAWGIPFDVFRLDQQFLDRSLFIDANGNPRYGTIIWNVNHTGKLLHPDMDIVANLVEKEGVGLIALSDRIWPTEIQTVLGLEYQGSWMSKEDLEVVKDHFLTKNLKSPLDYKDGTASYKQRMQVKVLDAETLVKQGIYSQVTARKLSSGAHAVWIGSDHNLMFAYQEIRTLLRRAISCTIGYNLYKTWEDEAVMIMDDPGNAQSAWLEHWHYPTLTADTIEEYLIKPLKKHNAILNINVVPGFVNKDKKTVEPTWTQKFTDEFGDYQDYPSTKKGIDSGVTAGVFEIMCHGLTHMQPDLTGWWSSPLDREKANVGWYREFGDTRRGKEIPAAEQLWRMETSKRWIEQQFGVIPLEFCAGGGGSSISYPNNTWRLAARAGFGWYGWNQGYLGKDMVIVHWDFFGTPESPVFVGAPPDGHDYGIARNPEAFASIFDRHPEKRFISINEFIGYLHSENDGYLEKDSTKIKLRVKYDDHYCRHFKNHGSGWKFELSDWLAAEMGPEVKLKVDGEEIPVAKGTEKSVEVLIPAGIGEHFIEIE
jgi:hypothetical protein